VNTLPIIEGFNAGMANVLLLGDNSTSSIDSLVGNFGVGGWAWKGQGSFTTGFVTDSVATGADVFVTNTTHIATMKMCVDLSAYDSQLISVSFDLRQEFSYYGAYSYFRLATDSVVLTEASGNEYFSPATSCYDAWVKVYYDLTAYAGTVVHLLFQSCNKYSFAYNSGGCGDNAYVDNINISVGGVPIFGCTDPTACNYDSLANTDDSSCEPTIIISGMVTDVTSPISTNGTVDLTVTGGTPCYNGAAFILNGTSSITTQGSSIVFDVVATSDLNITSIDQRFMASGGTANVWYRLGSCNGFEDAGLLPIGWMLAGSSLVNDPTTPPDIYNIQVDINLTDGDTVCIYVQGVDENLLFGAGVDSVGSVVSSDVNLSIKGGFASRAFSSTDVSIIGGVGGAPGDSITYPTPSVGGAHGDSITYPTPSTGSYNFGGKLNYSLSSYSYFWNIGDTTGMVAGLGMGGYSATVIDCNGCTGTWSGVVSASISVGCMDPAASNYDPLANTADTTCTYPGCTDPIVTNYDTAATVDDGSCN